MPSNGRDLTMDGLIRQSLASTADNRKNCPGPEILAAYYEHSLDSSEITRCETHLSQCTHCREQLAMMARAEVIPQRTSHRGWLWDWRLLASAATALVILAVWGARRSVLAPAGARTANEPLVAMSQSEQGPAAQSVLGQQQSAPSSEPHVKVPPAAPAESLVAPRAVDRVVPKTQTKLPDEAQSAQNEIQEPPINKRNQDLLQMKQGTRAAVEPGRMAEAKKDVASDTPAPAAAPPGEPNSLAAQETRAAGGVSAGSLGAGAATSDASGVPTPDALDMKQMQSAPKASAFGASVGGALGRLGGQRSSSTIIQTPDRKVLWRFAGGNSVERTEDGGATWHGQVLDPDALLTGGSAPSAKICWLVGKSGMILVTKDTTHWKRIPPPVPADFVAVDAKNASSATVTAVDGQKFSTDNEGKKWVPARQ